MNKLASVVLTSVLFLSSSPIHAQQTLTRIEFGMETTFLQTDHQPYDPLCPSCPASQWMIGPSLTVNINKNFAVDSSFGITPESISSMSYFHGGRTSQALVGLKASVNESKASFFAKVRPGVISVSNVVNPEPLLAGHSDSAYNRRTQFALDLGVGVEYAISPKMAIRGDIGTILVQWNSPDIAYKQFSSHLHTSTGLYYRLGKTVESIPAFGSENATHPFFDRKNKLLIATSLFANLANYGTTMRAQNECRNTQKLPYQPAYYCDEREMNAIARPFVKYGWAGGIPLIAINQAAEIGFQYLFHRTGHHRVERLIPVASTSFSLYAAHYDLRGNQW